MSGYDAEFSLSDNFAIGLWNPDHFVTLDDSGSNDKKVHATGNYGADVLMSLWVYRTSKNDTISQVATQLTEQLDKQIDGVIDELKIAIEHLKVEAMPADPIDGLIKLNGVAHKRVPFYIAEGKGCPIVYKLVRAFVAFDLAVSQLTELYSHGQISDKEYYERRKLLAKPLRRFVQESTLYIKRFHQKRKSK